MVYVAETVCPEESHMEEMNNGLLTLLSDAVQMFVYFSIILDDC
jgi:hypothetical protein